MANSPLLIDVTSAVAALLRHASPVLSVAHGLAMVFAALGLVIAAYRVILGLEQETALTYHVAWAAVAFTLLAFWVVPFPGTGSSVSTILPDGGNYLARLFHGAADREVRGSFAALHAAFLVPNYWDFLSIALYVILTCANCIVMGATLIVGAYSILAVGIVSLFGPIAIATIAWQPLRPFSASWARTMLKYSLVPAVLAAYVFMGMHFVGAAASRFPPYITPAEYIAYWVQAMILYSVYLFGAITVPGLTGAMLEGGMYHGHAGMLAMMRWIPR